jgi:hypothetical protein
MMVAYEVGDVDLDAVRGYLQGVVLMDGKGRGINQVVIVEKYTGWTR